MRTEQFSPAELSLKDFLDTLALMIDSTLSRLETTGKMTFEILVASDDQIMAAIGTMSKEEVISRYSQAIEQMRNS